MRSLRQPDSVKTAQDVPLGARRRRSAVLNLNELANITSTPPLPLTPLPELSANQAPMYPNHQPYHHFPSPTVMHAGTPPAPVKLMEYDIHVGNPMGHCSTAACAHPGGCLQPWLLTRGWSRQDRGTERVVSRHRSPCCQPQARFARIMVSVGGRQSRGCERVALRVQ